MCLVSWITASALALAQKPTAPPGFFPSSVEREMEAEAVLVSTPSPRSFETHFRRLTEEPHPAGSARNMELADYVRDCFMEYGLEDVGFHDTPALLSYGRSASVAMLEPVALELDLAEESYPEDKDSLLYEGTGVVPYHEYAASGDVRAEVVYANGGSPEDFDRLAEMGIDVRGKIVLMRYSVPYSYRGYKVYLAESRGAVGTILYSDPQDDGYVKGDTYPHGPWGPPSHVQWGSIVYDWLGFGETPFTFHWERGADGEWTEGPVRDPQLPKIPSIPMSHRSAAEILSRLRGPVVPEGWQGGLPFTYHVGPGPVRIRLRVENEETIRTIRNVIGRIQGSEEPEKWVVLGNHRDAWIYGGVDPSSGTAALLEAARAVGAAAAKGHRPKRTLVFANWDAEEDLLGGSTSWVKDHREKLLRDGIAYLNLDSGASGPDFQGGASPALADFLRDATRAVSHPAVEGSVYDAWASRFEGEPVVETIVGATDYTAFQENLGMSCIDLASTGAYGVYHSQYDDSFWVSRFGDPGFLMNTTLARLMSVLAWRLASADVLPFHYSEYAAAALEHIEAIEAKAKPEREIELNRARAAAERWRLAALSYEAELKNLDRPIDPERRKELNDVLVRVERAMTQEDGLESRPFFKHLVYAPQPTYRPAVLPRIFEAIESGDWAAIDGFEAELAAAFDEAAALMEQASALLTTP